MGLDLGPSRCREHAQRRRRAPPAEDRYNPTTHPRRTCHNNPPISATKAPLPLRSEPPLLASKCRTIAYGDAGPTTTSVFSRFYESSRLFFVWFFCFLYFYVVFSTDFLFSFLFVPLLFGLFLKNVSKVYEKIHNFKKCSIVLKKYSQKFLENHVFYFTILKPSLLQLGFLCGENRLEKPNQARKSLGVATVA